MSERQIIIEEVGTPKPKPQKPPVDLDLQDWLLIVGILSGEAAAIAIWWPSALILASLLSFCFAWLIERSKAIKTKPRGNS